MQYVDQTPSVCRLDLTPRSFHSSKPRQKKYFVGSECNLVNISSCAVTEIFTSPTLGEIAHTLSEDDEFEGFKLAAGTNVFWNQWHINMSPEEYPDPTRFFPDRFLGPDLDKPLKGHVSFGAGKSKPTY